MIIIHAHGNMFTHLILFLSFFLSFFHPCIRYVSGSGTLVTMLERASGSSSVVFFCLGFFLYFRRGVRSWMTETRCQLLISDFAGCESASGRLSGASSAPPRRHRSASLTGNSDYITGASVQRHANTISHTQVHTHTQTYTLAH